MKTLPMALLLTLSCCTAAQAKKPAATPHMTPVQKAQLNTEAKEYTAKECTKKENEYIYQSEALDPSAALMGNMLQGLMNQQFDAMMNGMAKQGYTIQKVSNVQGGKRSYVTENKSKTGIFFEMLLSGNALSMYGCQLR